MPDFTIHEKNISVYPSSAPAAPVIYLNTFAQEGERVWKEIRKTACPNFTFVTISGINWNHDMSPWSIPPISAEHTPCTGGADEYLQLLINEIIPKVEQELPGDVLWRGLAGYSLAGLFALYALYQTEIFNRIAAISGSFWFPAFQEYVFSHEIKKKPECIYFSLGKKECQTKNPCLKTVQECTENIESFYRSKGIYTTFQSNPGGHFYKNTERTAAGIRWILNT